MTLVEFERWLLCQIAIYHHAPHSALGGLCPAQMWEREAAKHSPLLPVRSEEHTSELQSLMRISYAVFCLKKKKKRKKRKTLRIATNNRIPCRARQLHTTERYYYRISQDMTNM